METLQGRPSACLRPIRWAASSRGSPVYDIQHSSGQETNEASTEKTISQKLVESIPDKNPMRGEVRIRVWVRLRLGVGLSLDYVRIICSFTYA